jgi:hypothetical protein
MPACRHNSTMVSHGLEASLDPVHSDRNAVDQRKRLRVLGEYKSEHACDNVTKLLVASMLKRKLPWFRITTVPEKQSPKPLWAAFPSETGGHWQTTFC